MLGSFIEDIQAAASLEAADRGLEFAVSVPAREGLAVDADGQILAGAVANLVPSAMNSAVLWVVWS